MEEEEYDEEIVGAIKIKDGLFIGDEFASTVSIFQLLFINIKDMEFIQNNKVTRIINCAGQEV